jgi:hypothetical protein
VPLIGALFGSDVQAAAEAAAEAQGVPAGALADVGVRFDEGGVATDSPVAVALIVAALAALNFGRRRIGRVLSLVIHPLLLVLDLVILVSQASAAKTLEAAFRASSHPELHTASAQAILDAAEQAYPAWVPALTILRVALAPLCSLLVIALLARPSARIYFRAGNRKGANR